MALRETGKALRAVSSIQGSTLCGWQTGWGQEDGGGEDSVTLGDDVSKEARFVRLISLLSLSCTSLHSIHSRDSGPCSLPLCV